MYLSLGLQPFETKATSRFRCPVTSSYGASLKEEATPLDYLNRTFYSWLLLSQKKCQQISKHQIQQAAGDFLFYIRPWQDKPTTTTITTT